MIPRKLHYCWFGENKLPEVVVKCLDSWKEHLNDFEFILWNEKNSPMNHQFVKSAYSNKKYAFVADYVRLWALYQQGGVYLDTDMLVINSFDNLLSNDVFFGFEECSNQKISAGIIGAKKENCFIKEILTKYDSIIFDSSNLSDMIIPKIITATYKETSLNNNIKLYDFDYFYPFPYVMREDDVNPIEFKTVNTIAIHLWDRSWFSKKEEFYVKMKYYYNRILSIMKISK